MFSWLLPASLFMLPASTAAVNCHVDFAHMWVPRRYYFKWRINLWSEPWDALHVHTVWCEALFFHTFMSCISHHVEVGEGSFKLFTVAWGVFSPRSRFTEPWETEVQPLSGKTHQFDTLSPVKRGSAECKVLRFSVESVKRHDFCWQSY